MRRQLSCAERSDARVAGEKRNKNAPVRVRWSVCLPAGVCAPILRRRFARGICAEKPASFRSADFRNLIRRAHFFYHAVRHKDDLVRHIAREVHFVRDDNHSAVARFQPFDDFEHLARQFGVESGGRLVEAKDVGREREGARNGYALLLSARKFARICRRTVTEPDSVQKRLCASVNVAEKPFAHSGFSAFTLSAKSRSSAR